MGAVPALFRNSGSWAVIHGAQHCGWVSGLAALVPCQPQPVLPAAARWVLVPCSYPVRCGERTDSTAPCCVHDPLGPIPSSSHPMPPPIGSEDWCSSTRCPQPFPAIQAATALPAAAGPEPGFLLTPILKGNSRWIGRFLETSQTRLRLQTELLLFGKEAQLRPAPAVCAPLPIAHPPPLPPIALTASPRSLSSCIALIPLFWPPSVLLQGAQSPAGTTAPGALGGWTERRVVGFARGMWSELARKQSSPKSHPIIFPNQSTAKTSFRFG